MAGFADMMAGTAQAPQQAPQAAPGPGMGPPGSPPAGAGIGNDEAREVTPELQEEYNKFVSMGLLLLFEEKMTEQVIDLMLESPNLTDTVARVAAGIVTRVYAAAAKQGEEVTPEVVLHGGWEILNEVAGLASAAGAGDLDAEEIESAFYIAADAVRDMMDKQGMIPPDRDDPDRAVERARAEVGDDGLRAVIDRVKQVQGRTAEGLQSRLGGKRRAQQEMPQ